MFWLRSRCPLSRDLFYFIIYQKKGSNGGDRPFSYFFGGTSLTRGAVRVQTAIEKRGKGIGRVNDRGRHSDEQQRKAI
jgi:hypothetical protein